MVHRTSVTYSRVNKLLTTPHVTFLEQIKLIVLYFYILCIIIHFSRVSAPRTQLCARARRLAPLTDTKTTAKLYYHLINCNERVFILTNTHSISIIVRLFCHCSLISYCCLCTCAMVHSAVGGGWCWWSVILASAPVATQAPYR